MYVVVLMVFSSDAGSTPAISTCNALSRVGESVLFAFSPPKKYENHHSFHENVRCGE